MVPDTLGHLEVWLVTGSQELYGPATLRQVEAHAREVAAGLDAQPAIPVRVVPREVATSPGSIRRVALDANAADTCIGVIAWMHTFSPAKMWIAGLGALQKPLLHLHTQFNRDLPWAEIDMDFMNLNQSAHGDREFGFLETRMRLRRKTVVGHWRDPEVAARVGVWTRAAAGWHEAQSLQVARFGDNMREVAVTEGDKVEAQIRLGCGRQRLRRGRARGRGRRRFRCGGRPSRRGVRGGVRARSRPALRRRAPGVAAGRGAHRGRVCASSSIRGGSGRSPTRSRISDASRSCPASLRSV